MGIEKRVACHGLLSSSTILQKNDPWIP